jgi:hypothetical protein
VVIEFAEAADACETHGMSDALSGRVLLWETIQQKENYPIFRLTYLSSPVKPFTDDDFEDIESKSMAANNARDVTGLLIVHDDRILQILEGREDAVRELYAKIEADSRHKITKLVSETEDEERMLLTWNMVVRGMANIPDDVSEQYARVYDGFLHSGDKCEITIDHIDLFKTIALLGPLPL